MQKDGAAFAGFATHLDLTPADPDMFAIPDPASLMILPWKPEIAWVAADLHLDGAPLAQAPRQVLKRQLATAETQGYRLRTGVEAEFFVLQPDAAGIADGGDRQATPLLRPGRPRSPLRADPGDQRRDARARLGALSKRSRGRERPIRDELDLRRCTRYRRPPCVLQIHGEAAGREPRGCGRHSCRSRSPT